MKIAVYIGAGTCSRTRSHALSLLNTHFPNARLIHMRGADIPTLTPDNIDLLVMPGGPSTPMAREITYHGLKTIKNYVATGGKYLGFCGGAYLATQKIIFTSQDEHLIEERPLTLYPGTKQGPYTGQFSYHNNCGFHTPELTFHESHQKLPVILNGGGFFENAAHLDGVHVVATYPTGEAAIVLCQVGNGLALLSGPHLEYDPLKLNVDRYITQQAIDILCHTNPLRHTIWQQLFAALDIASQYTLANHTGNSPIIPSRNALMTAS